MLFFGADAEQLSATMAQLSRWMGALLGGGEAMPGGADSLDISADSAQHNGPLHADTLGGVVTQIMQLLNTVLNGTDAQVIPLYSTPKSEHPFCARPLTFFSLLLGPCERLVPCLHCVPLVIVGSCWFT